MPSSKKPNPFAKFAGTTGPEVSNQQSTRLDEAVNSSGHRLAGALEVPLASVVLSPLQIRQNYEPETLAELAADIKERGILQPLLVRVRPDRNYEVIAGERRLRAATQAGLTQVPVIVKDMDDEQARLTMLIENIQRQDLTPDEEKVFFEALQAQFGYGVKDIARLINKSSMYVSRRLSGQVGNGKAISDSENLHNDNASLHSLQISQSDKVVERPRAVERNRTPRPFVYNAQVYKRLQSTLSETLSYLEQPVEEPVRNQLRDDLAALKKTLAEIEARLDNPSTEQRSKKH